MARQSVSGWTSLKTITDSQAHVTLYADKVDEQAVILKKSDSDTDFLVAEYREKKDSQENGNDNGNFRIRINYLQSQYSGR